MIKKNNVSPFCSSGPIVAAGDAPAADRPDADLVPEVSPIFGL